MSRLLFPYLNMDKQMKAMPSLQATLSVFIMWIVPRTAQAIQLHNEAEGIIVHQAGHAIFLLSMLTLIFSISGKGLSGEKGWRLIQYSAVVFILWNLDTLLAHFIDNQINAVHVEMLSLWEMKITALDDNQYLAGLYYLLKLDHLLVVPAIFLFYLGLSNLLKEAEKSDVTPEIP